MANTAINTAYIRGEKEQVEKVIPELGKIYAYGDEIHSDDIDDNEYYVEFYSKWCEPMQRLIDLSKEYNVEIDGFTTECGTGYYSEWIVKNGEQISRYYCKLDRDNDGCPYCGEVDNYHPENIEACDTLISDIWYCDECHNADVTDYVPYKVAGSEELLISLQ